MNDLYLNLVNSGFGARIARALGLPMPVFLERHRDGDPVINGVVLVGGGGNPELQKALALTFKSMATRTMAHAGLPQWITTANEAGLTVGNWVDADQQSGGKLKGLVFDATGIEDSTQSDSLYQFFHDAARSVLPCGRVVVLGRPPEPCNNPKKATIQRALEGLTRSLGKELGRAITVQLVYVAEGAENQIESTLRFLLSPRSAYVSGQVIRITPQIGSHPDSVDWVRPLSGKKVLVTGASRGIGAAIAEVMVRDGALVTCLDVPQAQAALDEIAVKLDCRVIALDIGAAEAPQQLVDAARARRVGRYCT
jgi:3-oxoacyl-[acyl-carrier protein] reductase